MGKEKLLPPPLLLTSHGEESAKQSIYNILENRYQTTCIPVLSNKSVLGSAYGWLVLLERSQDYFEGDCCLWNPTSMEIIQLHGLYNPCPYNRCIMSKPPTDPDCFLVFNQINSMEQLLYRIGDHAFFKVKSVDTQGYRLITMLPFQGMIYGIVEYLYDFTYEFVTIHMVGDTLEMRALLIDDQLPWDVPQPLRSWITKNMNYLIELTPCGNEFLLVIKMSFAHYLDNAVHFRVFRVDVGRKECEELDNLDGLTIFINFFGNGFCRSSESFGAAIKHNSIYYTNCNGRVVYVYDLDDRSTIMFQPYPDADIDPDTSENFWVDQLPENILNSSGAT